MTKKKTMRTPRANISRKLTMDKLYFLLLLTLVAGCATISEGGKKVKLTENISDIENCKYLNKMNSEEDLMKIKKNINTNNFY